MKNPEKCGDIIRAVKSKVDVPVSAKIRLGWTMDEANFKDVIDELQSADVDPSASSIWWIISAAIPTR